MPRTNIQGSFQCFELKELIHAPFITFRAVEDCSKDLHSVIQRENLIAHLEKKYLPILEIEYYPICDYGSDCRRRIQNDYLKNSLKHIAYAMTKAKHLRCGQWIYIYPNYISLRKYSIYTLQPSKNGVYVWARDNGIRIYNEN